MINGLNRISRIPQTHQIPRYHKGFTPMPDNIERKLDEFYTEYCLPSHDIYIGYNSFQVLIRTRNIAEWTKELHATFCKKLGMILHAVNKSETWDFNSYQLIMDFMYIPKYFKDKWNDEFSVDFNNLRL